MRRAARDTRTQRLRERGACSSGFVVTAPPIPESGEILDLLEFGIDAAELLANALDDGAHGATQTLAAIAGEETPAVDCVIDFAVADVVPAPLHEGAHDVEFAHRKLHRRALPGGALARGPERQMPDHEFRGLVHGRGLVGALAARLDEGDPLQEDRE